MLFDNVYTLLAETRFYHKELNKQFWKNDEFDPEVRKKLIDIVNDFICKTSCPVIDDIQLTGSLANFNYTPYSDLDVHILLDFSSINDDTGLVKKALDGKRFVWNLRHEINIRGHEVEVYFQDTKEPHISSGLFSLMHNKWVKVPAYNPPEIDAKDVDKKADDIIDTIDRLQVEVDKDVKGPAARPIYNKGTLLKSKLQKMRQAGLDREGEFSIENLAFIFTQIGIHPN